MATFPTSYRETLNKSTLTNIRIAQIMNITSNRLQNLFSGKGKMDMKEFRDMKNLVEQLNNGVLFEKET